MASIALARLNSTWSMIAFMDWSQTNQFSTVRVSGGNVFKKGKIFQCGDYPDKGINVEVQAFRDANKTFAPVPINSEHWASVFDGKLGDLIAIETADDGTVFGLLSVPKALSDLLGDTEEWPVSIELSPSFAVVGLALAKFPRVTDAAVFSALGVKPPEKREENRKMSLKSVLKQVFTRAIDELPEDAEGNTGATVTTAKTEVKDFSAELAAETEARKKAEDELAAMRTAQNEQAAKAETANIARAGKAFADEMVADRRVLPAQAEAVALQYGLALRADNEGKACFSDDNKPVEGANVKALRDMFKATPQHQWTADLMGAPQFKAMSGNSTDEGMSAARKAELMGKSSLGRQAVKNGGKC